VFNKKNNLVITISLFCIILFKRLIFLNLGVNLEEAKDLEAIIKITNGEVLYRDFYYIYGFLGLYLNAAVFKLFGVADILIPRLIVSLFFASSVFFAYKIALRFVSPFWAFVAVLLGFSGLVTREHTYGHIFAFAGIITSLWAGLSYINERNLRYLILAGLSTGIALISKPLPQGILASFALMSLLVYEYFFIDKKWNPLPYVAFILSLLIFPSLGVLYFYSQNALLLFLKSLFPMFSGGAFHPSTYFYIPSIVPDAFFSARSLGELKAILNIYLYQNLRWWLISILFIIGIAYSIRNLYRDRQNSHFLSVLFLSSFSMVFELQRILIPGLNPYVSLFPTFVLLIYFGIKINTSRHAKQMVQIMIFLLLFLYFIYPPLIYYINYKNNGQPLRLKYADNVIVKPFTYNAYREAVSFIKEKTDVADKIVVADYNSFFFLFSERENLFSENFYLFSVTTFHPLGKSFSITYKKKILRENAIIERIKTEKPALVLIPSDYLTANSIEQSVFLKYIINNWNKCKETGVGTKRTAFDNNIGVTIFCSSERNF